MIFLFGEFFVQKGTGGCTAYAAANALKLQARRQKLPEWEYRNLDLPMIIWRREQMRRGYKKFDSRKDSSIPEILEAMKSLYLIDEYYSINKSELDFYLSRNYSILGTIGSHAVLIYEKIEKQEKGKMFFKVYDSQRKRFKDKTSVRELSELDNFYFFEISKHGFKSTISNGSRVGQRTHR